MTSDHTKHEPSLSSIILPIVRWYENIKVSPMPSLTHFFKHSPYFKPPYPSVLFSPLAHLLQLIFWRWHTIFTVQSRIINDAAVCHLNPDGHQDTHRCRTSGIYCHWHILPPTQARSDLKAQLSIPLSIIFCSSLLAGTGRPPITEGFRSLTGLLSPMRWSRIILYWSVGLFMAGPAETGPCESEEAAFASPVEAAMFLNDSASGKCSQARACADSSYF